MAIEGIVIRVLIGAIAGALADVVVGESSAGLLGTVLIGVIGAVVGAWLFTMLGLPTMGGILWQGMMAFVGAVCLLLVLRLVRRGI